MDDKEEILTAIGDINKDVAVLQEKYDNLAGYIFKDLKPDIESLCGDIKDCMECTHKNFRWMAATMVTSIVAIVGWVGLTMVVL